MELIVKGSFYRDLLKYSDSAILKAVYETIKDITEAKKISQLQDLKKLRKYKTLYRIKIADHYRMGIVIRNNKVWLVRFCHRNVFYTQFP